MNEVCTSCRYYELTIDSLPCKQCMRCTSDGVNKWAPPIDEIFDPFEKLEALCELQMYTMLSMVELREKVDSFIEELKEREGV